jgi:hypothetical protein
VYGEIRYRRNVILTNFFEFTIRFARLVKLWQLKYRECPRALGANSVVLTMLVALHGAPASCHSRAARRQ